MSTYPWKENVEELQILRVLDGISMLNQQAGDKGLQKLFAVAVIEEDIFEGRSCNNLVEKGYG